MNAGLFLAVLLQCLSIFPMAPPSGICLNRDFSSFGRLQPPALLCSWVHALSKKQAYTVLPANKAQAQLFTRGRFIPGNQA